MYRILKDDLTGLYARLAQSMDVFVPLKSGGQTNFGLWAGGKEADLDTLKTVKSPKDVFFPQSETLYSVSREEGKLKVTPEQLRERPFAVLGIRPCDVQGIRVLDKVFLSEPVDTFYAARREKGTLVSLACARPAASCFCGAFGIDCTEPDADVAAWLWGDYLYWQPKTEKGEALTQAAGDLLEQTDEVAVAEAKAAISAIRERLPLKDLSLEGWGAEAAQKRFDSPIWEEMAGACLACGTCTFVCPTCQCYDIKDYTTSSGVQRYRCWDSCMYSDFTMMAHGNNRTTQMQRYRQRFLHKLAYFPANNDGMFSCVGCGRCVDKCPSHLNIVKVIKAFGKEEA